MTKEEKELLMRYLCSMLPYGLMVQKTDNEGVAVDCRLVEVFNDGSTCNLALFNGKRNCVSGLENIKPYLRRMTSMTEKEWDEYRKMLCGIGFTEFYKTADKILDFLYKNHFDFRGLIPKGLANEAPEGMYNN